MVTSWEFAVQSAIKLGQLTGKKRQVRSIQGHGGSWVYYVCNIHANRVS